MLRYLLLEMFGLILTAPSLAHGHDKQRPHEQSFDVLLTWAEVQAGSARIFNESDMTKNRPREHNFDVLLTWAEVQAGSAR